MIPAARLTLSNLLGIPASVLGTTIAVIASLSFAYLTHEALASAKIDQTNRRTRLIELERQHDAAQSKETDSRLANLEYAQLHRAGLTTPITRLQLAETLETLLGKARAGKLSYTLTEYFNNISNSSKRSFSINVIGTISDETAFLTLLSHFASPAAGGFRPVNCTLTPASSSATKEIQIDCQLIRPALTLSE